METKIVVLSPGVVNDKKEIRWRRDKTSNSIRLNDRSKNGKARN